MARKREVVLHCCGDCANAVHVTEFHTLTVHGRAPTLGRCPYEKDRCVLLSEIRECRYYKKRWS